MTIETKLKREPEFDPVYVRDVSELVYAERLGKDDAARMIAKDGHAKLRDRAGSLDQLTRAYLKAMKMEIKND